MERRGDRQAEPEREAARDQDPGVPPLGRVRHHGQLHQVPQGRRPGGLEVPAGKEWQAKGGQAAQGSSGVASQVKQTDGAICYFELSYATAGNIPTVELNTGASAPVEATVENASKAISEAKIVGTGKDLALELELHTKADGAYPITLVTYEIVCDKGNKADTLPPPSPS